jgi:hypothetical protein
MEGWPDKIKNKIKIKKKKQALAPVLKRPQREGEKI